MVPSADLMATGGDPDIAPLVMKFNAEVLLNDRCRLRRMQEFHGGNHISDMACEKEKPLD